AEVPRRRRGADEGDHARLPPPLGEGLRDLGGWDRGVAEGDARRKMSSAATAAERVLAYHERTKHHPQRFAVSLGSLDWATQPDPFRTHEGAPRLELPRAARSVATRYADLFTRDAVAPAEWNVRSLGIFFELALGITAWKRFQSSR